jgi:hypothetical protein
MSIDNLIVEIDAEIARLEQARTLLSGAASPATKKRGRPAGAVKAVKAAAKPAKAAKKAKRNISPEGRARIAAAVKARWARVAAQKKAAAKAPAKAAAKPAKKAPAKKAPAKAVETVEPSTPQQ